MLLLALNSRSIKTTPLNENKLIIKNGVVGARGSESEIQIFSRAALKSVAGEMATASMKPFDFVHPFTVIGVLQTLCLTCVSVEAIFS